MAVSDIALQGHILMMQLQHEVLQGRSCTTSAVAAQVRADPGAVLKLRCLFLKLRSLLEVPLLRMGQARSPAAAPTSRVYSSALVAFSRRLLQVCTPAHLATP